MPLMPANYKSLTDMAIETAKSDWEAKQVAIDTSIKEQEAKRKQEYLAQMAQVFQQQQPVGPAQQEKLANSEIDLADRNYLQSSSQEIDRMKKLYEVAARNGDTTSANMWRDNITATEKAMFDYQDNIKKEKATKITEASQALMGVTDQASYQTAIEHIRDNIDPQMALKMFKQLGPKYNTKVAQQIKTMAYSGISADKQVDNARQLRQVEQEDQKIAETKRQHNFDMMDKNRKFGLAREGLELKKNKESTKEKALEKSRLSLVKGLDGIEQRFTIEERQIRNKLAEAKALLDSTKPNALQRAIGYTPSSIGIVNAKLDSLENQLQQARALKEQQKQSLLDNYRAIGIELDEKDTKGDFEEID